MRLALILFNGIRFYGAHLRVHIINVVGHALDEGFIINLWSLSCTGPDVNGDANNFDNSINHSWTLVLNRGDLTSISGTFGTLFNLNVASNNGTSGFANALATISYH